jgi:hypothetical protein
MLGYSMQSLAFLTIDQRSAITPVTNAVAKLVPLR